MRTLYLIPRGTHGTITVPGNEPKPHVNREPLQFTEPPELTENGATFPFGTWKLTVPRTEVIVSRYDGTQGWNVFGV